MARPYGILKHDLTGKRFGRFTISVREGSNKYGAPLWRCHCDCGNIRFNQTNQLIKGIVVSCGCWHKEMVSAQRTTHGMCGTRTYTCWSNMLQRCTNTNNHHYHSYGGRGIKVCKRWKEFKNFLDDMGECPPELTIDRIESSKGYNPKNCRWATKEEQKTNRVSTYRRRWWKKPNGIK